MNRIDLIASHTLGYKVIADIGCDHGYTIKSAFDNYGIEKAYAIDNKVGPLNQAIVNLRDYHDVVFSVSDGLTEMGEDTEVLIISGMGGDLIRDILESRFEKLKNVKRIVTQANLKDKVVRQFLLNNGYTLESEEIILEDHYYIIDTFIKGTHDYSDIEIKYGPILYRNRPSEFINMWNEKISQLIDANNEYTLAKAETIRKDLNI